MRFCGLGSRVLGSGLGFLLSSEKVEARANVLGMARIQKQSIIKELLLQALYILTVTISHLLVHGRRSQYVRLLMGTLTTLMPMLADLC